MDGTLIDSNASADRCWRRWAAEFGLPDPENFQVRHGVPATQVVPTLLPPDQVQVGIERILELECTDVGDIRVLPGAQDALEFFAPDGAAIVTSCTRDLARARIEASGLRQPAVIITADDVEIGKPHPDPFLRGAAAMGVSPERCLVVEDAPAGVRSGLDAGAVVLAVQGTHDPAALQDAGAVVRSIDEVRFAVGPQGISVSPA